jgi:hypothetical protein
LVGVGLAAALAVAACAGDRPAPMPEDQFWIQRSIDQVVFEQTAFEPGTLTPATADVRVASTGAAPSTGEPFATVQFAQAGANWLLAELHRDASERVLSLGVVGTDTLESGVYSASVELTWQGAANSPVQIEVILVVRPHPGLWTSGQPSREQRVLHTTTPLADGGALVVGGAPGVSAIERFDPDTGTWLPAGTLRIGRYDHTATLLENGMIFVAGGTSDAAWSDRPDGTWEIYDPVEGAVKYRGNLYGPRAGHGAVRLGGGRVLLVGGTTRDADGNTRDAYKAEIFDPLTQSSSPLVQAVGVLTSHTAVALLADGRVIMTSQGGDGRAVGSLMFDPSTYVWTELPSRQVARTEHALVPLADGRALVLGGIWMEGNPATPVASEIFDPRTRQWSFADPLHVAHGFARDTAVVLPSGRVLVAGGHSFSGEGMTSAVEVFDPSFGTWSVEGMLGAIRGGHTVTVLGDGRVVAVGGAGPSADKPEFWREPSP